MVTPICRIDIKLSTLFRMVSYAVLIRSGSVNITVDNDAIHFNVFGIHRHVSADTVINHGQTVDVPPEFPFNICCGIKGLETMVFKRLVQNMPNFFYAIE